MRKFSALLLTGLLFISLLAGCGGQTDVSSSLPDTTVSSTTTSSAAPETDETTTTATEDTTTATQDKTEPSAADTTTADKTDKSTTTTTGKTDKPTTTTTTRKSTTSKPTTKKPTTTQSQTPAEPLEILCWGDSLTQGAYMNDDAKEYPGILQSMIGDGYKVWNGGCNGDITYAIMARQGSIILKTKNDITFPAGQDTVTIGHRITSSGLMRDDGVELTHINIQQSTGNKSPMDIQINPVTINGKQYTLGFTFEGLAQQVDNHYNITITRLSGDNTFTIPAGSTLTLSNTNMSKKSYCDIFLMGANDSMDTNPSAAIINGLVDRYKKAIAYHGNERYIVIIPFWTDAYDAAFKAAFGDKALNFRELAYTKGLEAEGLTPNGKHDANLIAQKRVPASLRYNNKPNEIHLNEKGNHFLATCVYDKGVELGYWK